MKDLIDNQSAWTVSPAVARYRRLADVFPGSGLGQDSAGFDIWLFEIGNPNGGKVLMDGCLHGNEDHSSEIQYWLLQWLLTTPSTDRSYARIQRILSQNLVMFIPIILHIWDRTNWNHTTCSYGVNLNRNFQTGWPHIACSDQYSGVMTNNVWNEAQAEIETRLLRRIFRDSATKPDYYTNMHTGSNSGMHNGATVDVQKKCVTAMNLQAAIGTELGITPFSASFWGSTGSGANPTSSGFSISDAGSAYGIPAFLWECYAPWYHRASDYTALHDTVLPKAKVWLAAMCQACEGTAPPPPSCSAYTTQATCEGNGCYWYNGACHSSPAPPTQYAAATGGSTTPSAGSYPYNSGATPQVTANPSTGYSFVRWVLDGINHSENPISVPMTGNRTLTPVFAEQALPTANLTVTNLSGVPAYVYCWHDATHSSKKQEHTPTET
jgi:hypothetical protein